MKCQNCNNTIPEDSKFCTLCGNPVSDSISNTDDDINKLKIELDKLKNEIRNISRTDNTIIKTSTTLSKKSISIKKPDIKIPNINTSFFSGFHPTKNEIELVFGQNWLARIGSLAILFGMSFFIQAAIDSNWISNTFITALGIISGLLFTSVGYYLNNRFNFYSKILSGTGLGILYISIFGAYSGFEIINPYIGTIMIFIVSILGTFLSYKQKSISIGILSLLGAYSVPIITGFYIDTLEINSLAATGIYLPFVTISHSLFLIYFKNIYNLISLNFAGWVSFLIWVGGLQDNSISIETQFVICFFIFLIMISSWIWFVRNNQKSNSFQSFSLSLTTVGFILLSFLVLWDSDYKNILGISGLSLGILYLLPLIYGWLKTKQLNYEIYFAITSFIIFFISIPIQFSSSITTVFWSIQIIMISYLSYKFDISIGRKFSYLIFVLIIFKGFLWDLYNTNDMAPFINSRFLSLAFVFISGYTTYFLYKKLTLTNYETTINSSIYYLSILILLLVINSEIYFAINYFTNIFSSAYKTPLIFILWILSSTVISNAILTINKGDVENKIRRYFGYSIFIIFSILTLLSSIFMNSEKFIPFINIRTLLLIFILCSIFFTYKTISNLNIYLKKERNTIKLILEFLMLLIPFMILSIESYLLIRHGILSVDTNYYNPITSATWGVLWAGIGTIYIYVSMKLLLKSMRYAGLAAISISIIKLFIFDLFLLPTTIRIVAFILLGFVLLIAGLNYQKNIQFMKKIFN